KIKSETGVRTLNRFQDPDRLTGDIHTNTIPRINRDFKALHKAHPLQRPSFRQELSAGSSCHFDFRVMNAHGTAHRGVLPDSIWRFGMEIAMWNSWNFSNHGPSVVERDGTRRNGNRNSSQV